jgi:membrane associated rhomboid family serine protease
MSSGPGRAPSPAGGDGFARQPALRTVVARGRRANALSEVRLVLRAVGIPHAVVHERGEHLLVVPATEGLRAAKQLEAYVAENAGREPPAAPPGARVKGVGAVLCWAAVLVGVFLVPGLREPGLLDGARVASGRWELLATALTLHSGPDHLAGNLVFGAVFVLLLAQLLGNGLTLLLVLLGGVAGNAVNVLARAETHRALGASTAVFAALGLLMALSSRWRALQGRRRLQRWAPLVAGLGLLGWLGTSGEHTDIPAHALGLGCGVILGLALGWLLKSAAPGRLLQWSAGLLAAALLGLAWFAALT